MDLCRCPHIARLEGFIYQRSNTVVVAIGPSPIVPKVSAPRPPQPQACRPAPERVSRDGRLATRLPEFGKVLRARHIRRQEEDPTGRDVDGLPYPNSPSALPRALA